MWFNGIFNALMSSVELTCHLAKLQKSALCLEIIRFIFFSQPIIVLRNNILINFRTVMRFVLCDVSPKHFYNFAWTCRLIKAYNTLPPMNLP
jgi:hypothetical protein